MLVRSMVMLTAIVSATTAARAEAISSARALFADAWKRSGCDQAIDLSLNSARYHELGGGYSLGMVLCRLEPHSSSEILFLVAPKTGGRPQLLQFQHWRDGKFVSTTALPTAAYHPETRTISSYVRYIGGGICGFAAGEWTWTGTEFTLTGYWDMPDCNDEKEFHRDRDRFRVFPPKT